MKSLPSIFSVLCLAVCLVVPTAHASPRSIDSARACLARGDVERGRDFLAAAHAQEPENPAITLEYATSLADAQEAKELYRELSLDSTASDSIKSEAHARLGGLAYVSRDYAAAVEHLEAACKIRKRIECEILLPKARREHQKNLDLKKALEASIAKAKLVPKGTLFTVQVGSYSSLENAQKQLKSVKSLGLSETRIVKAEITGVTLYRVRVGSFPNRDEAQAFARRKLRPHNVLFGVVPE